MWVVMMVAMMLRPWSDAAALIERPSVRRRGAARRLTVLVGVLLLRLDRVRMPPFRSASALAAVEMQEPTWRAPFRSRPVWSS